MKKINKRKWCFDGSAGKSQVSNDAYIGCWATVLRKASDIVALSGVSKFIVDKLRFNVVFYIRKKNSIDQFA